jgi:hypothetical protein
LQFNFSGSGSATVNRDLRFSFTPERLARVPLVAATLVSLLAIPRVAVSQSPKDVPAAKAPAAAPSPADLNIDPREWMKRAADNEFQNEKLVRSYTYIQREDTKKLDSNGRVTSHESETSEMMILYNEPKSRLIARNDQPLSPKEAAKVEEKLNSWMTERRNESPAEKQKRIDKEQKEKLEAIEFIGEVADAYNFHVDGIDQINGRDAYAIRAEPRPDFQGKTRAARLLLPYFRFKVWIDKADCQWVKLDAEAIANATYGLFLVRLHKGTQAHLEQTRVNDEVWLPKYVNVKVDARIVIFKSLLEELDFTYQDYKKFRSEVRIGTAVPTN